MPAALTLRVLPRSCPSARAVLTWWSPRNVCVANFLCLASEWRPAGQHFEEQHADRVDVRAYVEIQLLFTLLGTGILRGPGEGALGLEPLADPARQAKINQPYASRREKDVLGLQVEMEESSGVDCTDGIAQRSRSCDELVVARPTAELSEALRQSGRIEQL